MSREQYTPNPGLLPRVEQTHSVVNVPLSGAAAQSGFIDCNGYSSIGLVARSDAAHNWRVKVIWSMDGITGLNANYIALSVSALNDGAAEIPVIAPYARVELRNDDSAAAHVMSCWAYLKK